jgi:hypothetical protein
VPEEEEEAATVVALVPEEEEEEEEEEATVKRLKGQAFLVLPQRVGNPFLAGYNGLGQEVQQESRGFPLMLPVDLPVPN